MTTYKVVAPYVTLKVQADDGSEVVKGFYAGAIVDAVDEDQAKAQAEMGLLEKASRSEAKAASEASSPPEEPPADQAPGGNASREDWAAYATSKGAPAEETRPLDEGGLKQSELRAKYGA